MLDYGKNAQPLYLQIKNIIKKDLDDKVYDIGDILPSELEFQERFGVSRITVRNAINELVKEGYLNRTRGKGTVVIFKKLNEKISRTRSFTEEMQDLGLVACTKSVRVEIVQAENYVAEHLGVNPTDFVYRIDRVRGTEKYPIVLFESYFAIDRRLPVDKELYFGSLYDTLKESCGIDWKKDISRYSDRFEAIKADSYLAGQLEVKPGSMVLKRISQTCDSSGRIFEFTICYYRGDKYSCTIFYQ